MENKNIFIFDNKKYLIFHREAVTVDELIGLGKELGCIE